MNTCIWKLIEAATEGSKIETFATGSKNALKTNWFVSKSHRYNIEIDNPEFFFCQVHVSNKNVYLTSILT